MPKKDPFNIVEIFQPLAWSEFKHGEEVPF